MKQEIDKETMAKVQRVYDILVSKGKCPVDENGKTLTVEELAQEHVRIKNSDAFKEVKRLAGIS